MEERSERLQKLEEQKPCYEISVLEITEKLHSWYLSDMALWIRPEQWTSSGYANVEGENLMGHHIYKEIKEMLRKGDLASACDEPLIASLNQVVISEIKN